MALGEAEGGEPLELLPDLVGRRAGHTALLHAAEALVLELLHLGRPALVRHGLAQAVALPGAEAGGDACQLHELFLEDGDPQRALEDGDGGRMGVAHLLVAVAAP